VLCVCVVEATNVSFACFQWVRQVLVCCSWPAHSINLSFPPLSPTHNQHTNKWTNDRTLKNFFSCKNNLWGYSTWNEMEFSSQFFFWLLTKNLAFWQTSLSSPQHHRKVRASPAVLSMCRCENVFQIEV